MPGGLGGTALNQTNERLSASLARYQPEIADNIKTRNVLLSFFDKRKVMYDGGTEVAVRFRFRRTARLGESGGGVNAFRYYDQLKTQPTDTILTGRETWSNLQHPISLSGQEQRENKGKNQFNRFKAKTEEAMDRVAEDSNDIFWGVAGGDQSILPTPITTIISGTDTATVHGIAKSATANTWLNSQASVTIGDAATNLLDRMTTGYNLSVDNSPNKSDKLDLFVSDRTVFEVIQGILPAYINVNRKGVDELDIGFPTVVYMGVPVQFDSTAPLDAAGLRQIYGLNSKYWEFAIDENMNYKTTQFYSMLPEQDADVAQLFLTFAIVCNQPRTNWRGTGITT